MIIEDHDIGGARVRRVFSMAGRNVRGGDQLSADEVLSIPTANRRALIDSGYIEVYPRPHHGASDAERHIVHVGRGQFDVIVGHKINARPLSKDEAEELATRPS